VVPAADELAPRFELLLKRVLKPTLSGGTGPARLAAGAGGRNRPDSARNLVLLNCLRGEGGTRLGGDWRFSHQSWGQALTGPSARGLEGAETEDNDTFLPSHGIE